MGQVRPEGRLSLTIRTPHSVRTKPISDFQTHSGGCRRSWSPIRIAAKPGQQPALGISFPRNLARTREHPRADESIGFRRKAVEDVLACLRVEAVISAYRTGEVPGMDEHILGESPEQRLGVEASRRVVADRRHVEGPVEEAGVSEQPAEHRWSMPTAGQHRLLAAGASPPSDAEGARHGSR